MQMKLAPLFIAIILSSLVFAQQRTLTNTDVVEMTKSGISEQTIILAIEHGQVEFDTSPEALIDLKKQGVPDTVMNAMLNAVASGTEGFILCGALEPFAVLFSSGDPGTAWIISHIPCRESITILGARTGQFSKIRTKSGQSGYVNSSLLREGQPPAIAPKAESNPAPGPPSTPTMSSVPGFPLTLRVLQTQRIPYSVQFGGGTTNTNCSISGSTFTTGNATTFGNYTYGNASSSNDLSMHCTSNQTTSMQWQHVLNAMLVVGSNNTAYIIACDAAWRWSKCRGLVAGGSFPAKVTSKGLAVQYYEKVDAKPKEAVYSILQMKSLSQ